MTTAELGTIKNPYYCLVFVSRLASRCPPPIHTTTKNSLSTLPSLPGTHLKLPRASKTAKRIELPPSGIEPEIFAYRMGIRVRRCTTKPWGPGVQFGIEL
jgi:hypothetical protein